MTKSYIANRLVNDQVSCHFANHTNPCLVDPFGPVLVSIVLVSMLNYLILQLQHLLQHLSSTFGLPAKHFRWKICLFDMQAKNLCQMVNIRHELPLVQ